MKGTCNKALGWVVELIIVRNLPLITPNKPEKNGINRPKSLCCNRQKLNPRWRSHQKIGPVDPGAGKKISGNQIQGGGRLGWVAEMIIERNLPLVNPNKPEKLDQLTQAFVL
jgi:hypothetical protein